MFYVIYNPDTKLYYNEGDWERFERAEQFQQPSPAILAYVELEFKNARWVGPCRVGEEP